MQSSDNVDYIFVINNPELTQENHRKGVCDTPFDLYDETVERLGDKLTVLNRENSGYDYAAHSHALFYKKEDGQFLKDDYNYFIFLNQTALGPFVPLWCSIKGHWAELLTEKINAETKLVGATINPLNWDRAHVQGQCFATDRVGLDIGITEGIFEEQVRVKDKHEVIQQKEIGYSRKIIENGYNISCLLVAFGWMDFRKQKKDFEKYLPTNCGEVNDDPSGDKKYFGTDIHPYECLFIKGNRGMDNKVVDNLKKWHNLNEDSK
jgi:hypothetical protein